MILINSSPKNTLKIFQPFLPVYVPLGAGSLLSLAEREKISVKFVDEQIENDTIKLVNQYVRNMQKPYIFAFSVLTIALKSALAVSKELKRLYPDSIIVFGGIHPSAMPDEVLSYQHINAVIKGEAEKVLFDFYRCVKDGRDFSGLENISYRKNGEIVHNAVTSAVDNLDNLPVFPYHYFNSTRYDLGAVISSRGCPYECIFCSNRIITGKKYRFRSAEVIVDDLELLYKKYNRRHINFVDDNLLVNKERIYSIIGNMNKRGLSGKLTFNFQARADNVSYVLLKDLFNSGFRSVFFGLETSSDAIMKTIKKNQALNRCLEAVRIAKKIGFYVEGTFIYGLPGETHNDRMKCVEISRELGLDKVRYNNATPYPGTELYRIAKSQNRLYVKGLYENFASVATFIENPFKRIPFSYVPEGNKEIEIRRDILFSFFSFYFDITKFKEAFKNPYEGAKWFDSKEELLKTFGKISGLLLLFLLLFVKFCQLFYYSLIKRESRIPLKSFMKVFDGFRIKAKV